MMNTTNYLKITILSLILSISTSCYRDIDLSEYRGNSVAVLNSIISTESVVMASVSHTWFYTDKNNNITIQDAKVSLYINDKFMEEMKYIPSQSQELNSTGFFSSGYTPIEGDDVRIVAETQYGQVSAHDIVPKLIEIEDVTVSLHKYTKWGQELYDITYNITFTDNPNDDNYYFIRIDNVAGNFDYTSDPVFVAQNNAGSEISGYWGRNFSDELFKGKRYTLRIIEPNCYSPYLNTERQIYLFSVSQSYYKYLRSLVQIHDEGAGNDLANLGITEPIKVFSNVIGGTGILGVSRLSTIKINPAATSH